MICWHLMGFTEDQWGRSDHQLDSFFSCELMRHQVIIDVSWSFRVRGSPWKWLLYTDCSQSLEISESNTLLEWVNFEFSERRSRVSWDSFEMYLSVVSYNSSIHVGFEEFKKSITNSNSQIRPTIQQTMWYEGRIFSYRIERVRGHHRQDLR